MLVKSSGQPTVQNILLAEAGQEYIMDMPQICKRLMIQVREFKELKIAFKQGESGTNYFTLKSGCTFYEDHVQGPFVIAVQAIENNTTIELVTWYHWD